MLNLQNLYNIFASSNEGKWIMVPENARELYFFVKQNPNIKRILDLGTGIGTSTAVMALALKDRGGEGHIDSIEQFDKCVKIANDLIPEELKEKITIHKSEASAWNTDKIPYQYFSIYDTLPEGDYDLIVNDGPSPMMVGESYVDLPNGTITKLLLEDKIKSGTLIAWDGRIAALSTLERYFGDNFRLVRIAPRGQDLNIIERKDNPVAFRDEKLELMKGTGYF